MTESGIVPGELAGGAFQPEVLLPVQQPPRQPATPEETLAAAVLEDAVLCARKYRHNGSKRRLRLFRETQEWFLSKQDDWPFAFERVCECLKLDPDCVRRAVGCATRKRFAAEE